MEPHLLNVFVPIRRFAHHMSGKYRMLYSKNLSMQIHSTWQDEKISSSDYSSAVLAHSVHVYQSILVNYTYL